MRIVRVRPDSGVIFATGTCEFPTKHLASRKVFIRSDNMGSVLARYFIEPQNHAHEIDIWM